MMIAVHLVMGVSRAVLATKGTSRSNGNDVTIKAEVSVKLEESKKQVAQSFPAFFAI